MPPKKNPATEDVDELRKSINSLTEAVATITDWQKQSKTDEEVGDIRKTLVTLTEETTVIKEQQNKILQLMEEVKQLRILNTEKDQKIVWNVELTTWSSTQE